MEKSIFAAALAACVFAAPSARAGDAAKTSCLDVSARISALAERYADSLCTVRYRLKKNARGDEPETRVPYKCPNCSRTHFESKGDSIEKGIPAEIAGFVLSPDTVLASDPLILPEFIDRIEIVCAGETVAAREWEASPENGALFLKTDQPLQGAKPLEFAAAGGDDSEYSFFYSARENGETVCGFAKPDFTKIKRHVEVGKSFYSGAPNTLVVDAAGEPVTVSLKAEREVGENIYAPPSSWKRIPAGERMSFLDAAEKTLSASVFPVYVQLEPEKSGPSRRWSFSGDDSSKNDRDVVGILLEGGLVLVPLKLSQTETSRMVKIEATAPGGGKIPLEFAGSVADVGAFMARFAADHPFKPAGISQRDAFSLFGETICGAIPANLGGAVDLGMSMVEAVGFSRQKGNRTTPEFMATGAFAKRDSDRKFGLALDRNGAIVEIELETRLGGRWSDETYAFVSDELAAFASGPVYDLENVPRKTGDRRRTPWLGLEAQKATPDVLREKKAIGFFKEDRSAMMVSSVKPGGPADRLGIKEGDFLVSVRKPGSAERKFDSFSNFDIDGDWQRAFDEPRFAEIIVEAGATPWPDVEKGVNETLSAFGVGAKVAVVWISGGVRREGETVLELAPVHYANAPRSRNRELGMTVCDMTDEVRKFLKLADDAPGVVVVKTKSGGVAAVSGIKPLEVVMDVNGEDVKSAKDFLEKTKGKKELSFTVRRLMATRVVPVKL